MKDGFSRIEVIKKGEESGEYAKVEIKIGDTVFRAKKIIFAASCIEGIDEEGKGVLFGGSGSFSIKEIFSFATFINKNITEIMDKAIELKPEIVLELLREIDQFSRNMKK